MFTYKKLHRDAKAPCKGSEFSAGYDLFSPKDITIPSHDQRLIKTDISVSINPYILESYHDQGIGIYFRIAPRSGLAYKNMINVHAGVVDSDYRGNVGVILMNHSKKDLKISKGDRIAQLIPTLYLLSKDDEFTEVKDLSKTKRGSKGYGSTGK